MIDSAQPQAKEKKENGVEPTIGANNLKRLKVDELFQRGKSKAGDIKSHEKGEPTQKLAMDCEMVGVGSDGTRSMLARCSVVNYEGKVVYDKFVKPMEKVTDYRTEVSGVRREDVFGPNAVDFRTCQKEIGVLFKNRTIIGHSLTNDFDALLLSHPKNLIRDTAKCKILCPKRPRALKKLCEERLGMKIQDGSHDSVEDARSVLALYKSVRVEWENSISDSKKKNKYKSATSLSSEKKDSHIKALGEAIASDAGTEDGEKKKKWKPARGSISKRRKQKKKF